VRILLAVNPRVPGHGKSAQGESDPKTRPKGVVDGQQVNIPVPLALRYYRLGGRGKKGDRTVRRVRASLRVACRKIRMRKPRGDAEPFLAKSLDKPPRKSSREWCWCPYQN
jgi:hypothetical protein